MYFKGKTSFRRSSPLEPLSRNLKSFVFLYKENPFFRKRVLLKPLPKNLKRFLARLLYYYLANLGFLRKKHADTSVPRVFVGDAVFYARGELLFEEVFPLNPFQET